MPYYVIDTDMKTVNGPFTSIADAVDEVSNIDEDDMESRFVFEVDDNNGVGSIEGAQEWFDENSDDDDESSDDEAPATPA